MILKKEQAKLVSIIRSSQDKSSLHFDGPGGTGKGTIGVRVAELIEAYFFSTGIIYRLVSYLLLYLEGFNPASVLKLTQLELDAEIEQKWRHISELCFNCDEQNVLLEHVNLGTQLIPFSVLRLDPQVNAVVSTVAGSPFTREQASEIYRELVLTKGRIVGDGRDGDRVLSSEALHRTAHRLKLSESAIPYVLLVYIFAQPEVLYGRAYWREIEKLGVKIEEGMKVGDPEFARLVDQHLPQVEQARIRRNIEWRNENDYDKPVADRLLRPAEAFDSGRYSLVIDSSDLNVDEVIVRILYQLTAHLSQ